MATDFVNTSLVAIHRHLLRGAVQINTTYPDDVLDSIRTATQDELERWYDTGHNYMAICILAIVLDDLPGCVRSRHGLSRIKVTFRETDIIRAASTTLLQSRTCADHEPERLFYIALGFMFKGNPDGAVVWVKNVFRVGVASVCTAVLALEEKWPLEKDLEEPKDEEHHFMTDELWAALDNLAEPEGTAPGLDKVQMSRKLF